MGAKQSKLDKLHELYTAELTRQLKDTTEPPTAALLAVIGAFLGRSGVKPVQDSPAHQRLMDIALPFKSQNEDASEKLN
jgi:hypothetical protein